MPDILPAMEGFYLGITLPKGDSLLLQIFNDIAYDGKNRLTHLFLYTV